MTRDEVLGHTGTDTVVARRRPWPLPLEEVIRIRTGERGASAI